MERMNPVFRTLALFALLALSACANFGTAPKEEPINPNLSANADLVVRAEVIYRGEGAHSMMWHELRIIAVLRNKSGAAVQKGMSIGVESLPPGIPDGLSTVYLEQLPVAVKGTMRYRWWLLGGTAATGVSHTVSPK